MAVNGIFVLVLVSETWSLYDCKASSVFAPFLTLYVSVKPKRVDSWRHCSIVNSCLYSYCSEIHSYPAVLIHLIIANSCNFSLVPHFFFQIFHVYLLFFSKLLAFSTICIIFQNHQSNFGPLNAIIFSNCRFSH